MPDTPKRKFMSLDFFGWVLFTLSSIGFIASSLKSGDMTAIVASFLFLVGCIAFLLPWFTQNKD
jgi:hypothetical protein